MYYVYILYSRTLKNKYVGYTKNLKTRFEHHNLGLDRYTKKGLPWILIYYEAYQNNCDAIRRERFLKTGKGREIMNSQIKNTLAKMVPPQADPKT